MHIFICDDDRIFADKFAELVKEELHKHQIDTDIHTFLSASALTDAFQKKQPCDILFLDIDMPETNGIDLAVSLKAYEIKPYLIFVSTVESLVYQTFKVNPFWFIRKRFCESELPEVITALLADMRIHLLETITLNCAHSIYTLHPLSICYVECQNKILHIHYANPVQNISIPYTLSSLEKELLPYGFLRVHKGFLVNYRYIFTINRQDIQLDNGEHTPVSKHRVDPYEDQTMFFPYRKVHPISAR